MFDSYRLVGRCAVASHPRDADTTSLGQAWSFALLLKVGSVFRAQRHGNKLRATDIAQPRACCYRNTPSFLAGTPSSFVPDDCSASARLVRFHWSRSLRSHDAKTVNDTAADAHSQRSQMLVSRIACIKQVVATNTNKIRINLIAIPLP